MKVLITTVAAGVPVEQVQLISQGIAEDPHVRWGHDYQVERQHRYVRGEPADGRGNPRGEIAAVGGGLLHDESKHPLRVGVAVHDPSILAELFFDEVEVAQGTIVSKGDVAVGERMGVLVAAYPGSGMAHMSDERGRRQAPSGISEIWIVPCRDRSLVQFDVTGRVEPRHPATVGVAVALLIEAVWRVEEPKRGLHTLIAGSQPEKAAHTNVLAQLLSGMEVASHAPVVSSWA